MGPPPAAPKGGGKGSKKGDGGAAPPPPPTPGAAAGKGAKKGGAKNGQDGAKGGKKGAPPQVGVDGATEADGAAPPTTPTIPAVEDSQSLDLSAAAKQRAKPLSEWGNLQATESELEAAAAVAARNSAADRASQRKSQASSGSSSSSAASSQTAASLQSPGVRFSASRRGEAAGPASSASKPLKGGRPGGSQRAAHSTIIEASHPLNVGTEWSPVHSSAERTSILKERGGSKVYAKEVSPLLERNTKLEAGGFKSKIPPLDVNGKAVAAPAAAGGAGAGQAGAGGGASPVGGMQRNGHGHRQKEEMIVDYGVFGDEMLNSELQGIEEDSGSLIILPRHTYSRFSSLLSCDRAGGAGSGSLVNLPRSRHNSGGAVLEDIDENRTTSQQENDERAHEKAVQAIMEEALALAAAEAEAAAELCSTESQKLEAVNKAVANAMSKLQAEGRVPASVAGTMSPVLAAAASPRVTALAAAARDGAGAGGEKTPPEVPGVASSTSFLSVSHSAVSFAGDFRLVYAIPEAWLSEALLEELREELKCSCRIATAHSERIAEAEAGRLASSSSLNAAAPEGTFPNANLVGCTAEAVDGVMAKIRNAWDPASNHIWWGGDPQGHIPKDPLGSKKYVKILAAARRGGNEKCGGINVSLPAGGIKALTRVKAEVLKHIDSLVPKVDKAGGADDAANQAAGAGESESRADLAGKSRAEILDTV